MIISASRRTDIPAFYGEWFMNRVNEGYFLRVNPMNPKQQKIISLRPAEVDCFVFWSKDPSLFLKNLKTLDERGYNYYFQFTVNDYPGIFEPRVPPVSVRTEIFKKLSEIIGPAKVIWRYDPIILSNQTPVEYHIDRFAGLASVLGDYTHRVIISFFDMYVKVNVKLKKLEKDTKLVVEDIAAPHNKEKLGILLQNLGSIARAEGLEMQTCAESRDLDEFGIGHGKCLDPELINSVFGLSLNIKKDPYQRAPCLCATSVDMGFYNTCRFNCSYCYATSSEKAVLNNMKKHNPQSSALLDHKYESKASGKPVYL